MPWPPSTPLGWQRHHDLAQPCPALNGHLGDQNPVGNIFQQQAKRARIIKKRRILKAARPNQIGLFGQRGVQPGQRHINKLRHHGRVSAGGFARHRYTR